MFRYVTCWRLNWLQIADFSLCEYVVCVVYVLWAFLCRVKH